MTAPATEERVRALRRVAVLLDEAIVIPGTGIRVGLDPILGLVPGLGDLAGGVLSLYVVLGAARLGGTRLIDNVEF
jgi:hypothetical protein